MKQDDALRRIRSVVFDFDGTLAILNIDFSGMRNRVFDAIHSFGIHEESLQERYLLEIIDEVYELLEKRDPSSAERFYQEAHRILYEVEMEAAGKGGLIPGVKKALESLRQRGIKVGIVTRNCEEAVRKVFPEVDQFSDAFISRNSVRRVKPHPDHLTLVMKRMNVSGPETLMVGDHVIDIDAGKKVGMRTVGVLTGRTRREELERAGADWVLEKASDVCSLLEIDESRSVSDPA